MKSPRPILIDTDPGLDDAIALLLTFASPELDLRGILTVAGNVPVNLTTRNALQICELAGKTEIPVYAGCPRPLLRHLETAESVHGDNGLADVPLPAPTIQAQKQHAVDFLIDTVMATPGITLCLLGPMTNLAVALIKEPRIAANIGSVVAMAGSFFAGGNSAPALEFNMQVDPHAAHVVMTAGLDVTLAPLDLTHSVLTTDEQLARVAKLPGRIGKAATAWLSFYGAHDRKKYGTPGGPLHDPCVIAYVLWPELFTGKRVAVDIDLKSDLVPGMTVMDWWGTTGKAPNALVLHQADVRGFYDRLFERIGALAAAVQ
ncbi:ribosylpyrimidine nucleosidase [Rhodospirillales bacterium TMPK1]|uniref:Ribosylpyrimidine nucleosidase n=2 Tax=Roseiterribacter gracilis TaxID=2812848 RepID=A0A8S8X5L3_9PROT|nr:ribosylpyrimidine nucleosidase [Rhodospirillales bacterium TMPK1]